SSSSPPPRTADPSPRRGEEERPASAFLFTFPPHHAIPLPSSTLDSDRRGAVMVRSLAVLPLLAAALAGGCLPTEFLQPDTHTEGAAAVPTSPFGAPPQNAAPVFSAKPPPSSSATLAVKVDEIGQRLLTCNPKLGMVPLFLTIGSPQPEMFHQGTVAVYITEGLVRQCKNEAELAALLSVELGRMVSERETMASPETRNPPKQSAMAIPMGNAGQF